MWSSAAQRRPGRNRGFVQGRISERVDVANVQNKRTSGYLFIAAGGMFLLAAFIGKQVAFYGIGAAFIAIGVSYRVRAKRGQ